MTPPPGPATLETAEVTPTVEQAKPQVVNAAADVKATRGGERKSGWEQFALGLFVTVPFLALIAAIPVMCCPRISE